VSIIIIIVPFSAPDTKHILKTCTTQLCTFSTYSNRKVVKMVVYIVKIIRMYIFWRNRPKMKAYQTG